MRSARVYVPLPADLAPRVKARAASRRVPSASIIREALAIGLEVMERRDSQPARWEDTPLGLGTALECAPRARDGMVVVDGTLVPFTLPEGCEQTVTPPVVPGKAPGTPQEPR